MRGFISTLSRLFDRENRAHFHLKCLGITICFAFAYMLYCSAITDIVTENNLVRQNSYFLSYRSQSNHFIYYPGSRCFEEMQQIQLFPLNPVNLTDSLWYHFHKYDFPSSDAASAKRSIVSNELLPFSE
jgi:hypothetical protein